MLNSVDVIDVLDPIPRLVPVGDAAGRFVQWRDGAVHLLDDRLSVIARRDLPLADDVCVLAASSLDRIVLDFAGGLAIAGDEVITVPGLRADAAAFLGHLLSSRSRTARDTGCSRSTLRPGTSCTSRTSTPPMRAHSCIRIRREIRPYSSSPWDRTAYSPTA
ncbi:hypothetical protein GS481_09525 [Rhodococcus hoagii]|nr:hypothetical protein [Prescottella equi]